MKNYALGLVTILSLQACGYDECSMQKGDKKAACEKALLDKQKASTTPVAEGTTTNTDGSTSTTDENGTITTTHTDGTVTTKTQGVETTASTTTTTTSKSGTTVEKTNVGSSSSAFLALQFDNRKLPGIRQIHSASMIGGTIYFSGYVTNSNFMHFGKITEDGTITTVPVSSIGADSLRSQDGWYEMPSNQTAGEFYMLTEFELVKFNLATFKVTSVVKLGKPLGIDSLIGQYVKDGRIHSLDGNGSILRTIGKAGTDIESKKFDNFKNYMHATVFDGKYFWAYDDMSLVKYDSEWNELDTVSGMSGLDFTPILVTNGTDLKFIGCRDVEKVCYLSHAKVIKE